MGVQSHFEVLGQLEIHGLGRETVERGLKLPWHQAARWEDWPELEADFLYGNPRCTGFSCINGSCGKAARGPWAPQTKDIHDFMSYGVRGKFPVMCWESVQQAWTTGRPLLTKIAEEVCRPNGYRVAHVFLNAASFGNAQQRRRYFFVAYRNDLKFNVVAPKLPDSQVTVREVLNRLEPRDVFPVPLNKKTRDFPADGFVSCPADQQSVLEALPQGMCLNGFAHNYPDELEKLSPRLFQKYIARTSEIPFSLHCLMRLNEDSYMPVLAGNCHRHVHPTLPRSITLREASKLMGWRDGIVPLGPDPFAQLGKGICPEVGEWLAEQVVACLDGSRDYDHHLSYNPHDGIWEGGDSTGLHEKVLNLSHYAPSKPSLKAKREHALA